VAEQGSDLPVTVHVSNEVADHGSADWTQIELQLADQLTPLLVPWAGDRRVSVSVTAATLRPEEIVRLKLGDQAVAFPHQFAWDALAYVNDVCGTLGAALRDTPSELVSRVRLLDMSQLADFVCLVGSAAAAASCMQPVSVQASEPVIQVLMEPTFLREFTERDSDGQLFGYLRTSLFEELGVPLPVMHLRADARLRPRGFALCVNGRRSMPRIGLQPDTLLVNASVDQLEELGYDTASVTINPASGQSAALTSAEGRRGLEELGFTVWDQCGYVILTVAASLRTCAADLLTVPAMQTLLGQVGDMFPILGAAANRHIGASRLAAVSRSLLREGVPIRNLRRIVELMLAYESEVPASGEPVEAFVRGGMSDLVTQRLARGQQAIVVYLLDRTLESSVRRWAAQDGDIDERLREDICAAAMAETRTLPQGALIPCLLTHDDLRAPLTHILRDEIPELRVIGYGDLPPQLNIQPVARIAVPTKG
jgi:flagellar biosynthesis component FlhA